MNEAKAMLQDPIVRDMVERYQRLDEQIRTARLEQQKIQLDYVKLANERQDFHPSATAVRFAKRMGGVMIAKGAVLWPDLMKESRNG